MGSFPWKSFLFNFRKMKKACDSLLRLSQANCTLWINFRENILYVGVQILFSSNNIYGCVFLIFAKIYARKWLCQAVCGHNIFFTKNSWCRWRDLNSIGQVLYLSLACCNLTKKPFCLAVTFYLFTIFCAFL